MDAIYDLARNVVERNYEDIPRDEIEMEKIVLLDIFGCIIAGATAPGCQPAAEYALDMGGKPESSILMYGGKVPAENAAFVNGIMAHALDYEASGGGPAHAHPSIMSAGLAISERLGYVSGREFLTALVLAIDTSYRIANSWNPRKHGWDPTVVVSTFGVVAMVGRLLKFNVEQMVSAFGVALAQLGSTPQPVCDGALAVKLHPGLAARAGIFSAAMVERGIGGPKNVLQGDYGYYKVYSRGECDVAVIHKNLGKKFHSLKTAFKGYPGTAFAMEAAEGVIELSTKHDIKPDDVETIIVYLVKGSQDFTGVTCGPFEIRECPQIDAVYSQRYAVASALLRRDCCLDFFTEPFVRDPRIPNLVKRVRIERVIEPVPGVFPPARVELVLKNGQRHTIQIDSFKGNIDRPLNRQEIIAKFRSSVAYSGKSSKPVPVQAGEVLLQAVQGLEELDDVGRIAELTIAR